MLRFTDITTAHAGTLSSLLRQTYAELLASDPARWEPEIEKWDKIDRAAYTNRIVGRCFFLTWADDALIGFGSFDPRGAPKTARIGHHCIVPTFRGRGYGRQQFDELLRRIPSVAEIHAFCLDLPFFAAAHRTYLASGFRIIGRLPQIKYAGVEMLHFGKAGVC